MSDQLAASFPTPRMSSKWYKKIFFYLYDMAVINAFVIQKHLRGQDAAPKDGQKIFRLALAQELIERFGFRSPGYSRQHIHSPLVRRPVTPPSAMGDHFPVEHPTKRYRRCAFCFSLTPRRRRESKSLCVACNVTLCTYGCFRKHHAKKFGW